jgi:hypothetical protein
MDKTSIAKKLLRIAEELLESGRLRKELVTEQNFPVLKLLNWEFIEEDDYGHGRVEIIGEKSGEELRDLFSELLGVPISYADIYVGDDLRVVLGIVADSKALMEANFDKDEVLTEEIQNAFEEYDGSVTWIEWIGEWLKSKGYEPDMEFADNTYNWDEWFGEVFVFVPFYADGESKMVVMWHLGGDVRGNYSYPEVWNANAADFIGEHPNYELVIDYLGYDSIEDMRKDLKILTTGYDDSGRLFDLSQQIVEEHGQQRLFDEG